nr:hypothetical protein [Brevundimonas sp. C43]
MRHLGPKNFLRIRRSRLALSCAPVLDPGLTTKNQDAAIQLIMDDSIAALGIAVDRRRVPTSASRAGYAAPIQVAYDRPRRLAGGVAPKDISDDFCFTRIDIAKATDRFADGIDFSPDFVAVDTASGMTTGPDDALKSAPCLSSCLAQLKGVQSPHQPNL